MHRKQMLRAEALEVQLQESRTECEIEIGSLRIERIEMLRRLRQMESESNFPDLFSRYENKIATLMAELEQCRASLVERETSNFLGVNLKDGAHGGGGSSGGGGEGSGSSKVLAAARAAERELTREVQRLRSAVDIADRKEAQFMLHKKHLSKAMAKLVPLEQQCALMEREMTSMQAQVVEHRTRAEAAEAQNAKLVQQVEALLE